MGNVFPHRIGEETILNYKEKKPYEYTFLPGYYLFELWGASGGGKSPGYGAFVSGILPIREKLTLYFYIGQKGINKGASSYNGGGKGKERGSSGGGSTDIRLIKKSWNDFTSLKSRIIVAAGGGGSQIAEYLSKGGSGGIIKGDQGNKKKDYICDVTVSKGGEQTKGGEHGKEDIGDSNEGQNGGFGYGGEGSIGDYNGNGGGGGYFGGGGSATASCVVGSGAGGSSYISGYTGCRAIMEKSTEKSLSFYDHSMHYSGLIFNQISVSAGSEIQWNSNGKIRIKCIKVLNISITYKSNIYQLKIFFIYHFCLTKY